MVKTKTVVVARPEKYATIPLEVFRELVLLLSLERQLEVESQVEVTTRNVVRNEVRSVLETGVEKTPKLRQHVYLPGKGPRRRGGSLGRFG